MNRDNGSATVELSLLAFPLILLLLFMVYAGRTVETKADVMFAAHEAARAASLATAADAHTVAFDTAAANITAADILCDPLDVEVDTTNYVAGGWVTVTVTCLTHLSDLALLNIPGTRLFEMSATEVVDLYRARGASER